MNIDAALFQKLLSGFKLEQLFNELGWDKPTLKPQTVSVNGEEYTLTQLAHKRGVTIFRCSPDATGKIPTRPVLEKIERETTRLVHEHLLIFVDAAESMSTWRWVQRAPGQPTATRTHTWHKGQSGESLRQKLSQIVWSLEEEEALTLTDVITGLRKAFDRDRISKNFYDKFRAQHEAFAEFIKGLKSAADQAWYASLMLNRLMFVYFIQKKGFLDNDENYLSNRMAQVRTQAGKGKFHSFYRQFLLRLFHEGLGQPKAGRDPALAALIGNVPYLNGGLFAVHELEEANPGIDVPDEAFEQLFAFFDAWDWHLDDRPLASGKEINPDVLGYIFEKYINQKQMGAYYTKEDITEYIGKNTLIPHLLEQTRERCKVAFEGEASVWNLLKREPDRYLYPAMKTGVIDADGNIVSEAALLDFVQTGMKDAKARMFDKRYNLGEAVFHTATGERGTLPTETWREYVERRNRCLEVREKLAKGEVRSADELITLNLDIRQFMQDVIASTNSPDLLRAVWQAIVGRVPEKSHEKFRHGITVLDPTCGSGAFLFAALNVLEPLYEACLDRMEGFVEDATRILPSPARGAGGESNLLPSPARGRGAGGEGAFADFKKALAEVGKHPSRRYYIYKNIILHNLFGVDIMVEAVEICKLRLFLKLVSQVDKEADLEPLPDIDFNIRAGNTLVGYATEAQFDAAQNLANDQRHHADIKSGIADLADLFDRFREQQTVQGGKVTPEDKKALRESLANMGLELDRYLARDYGIDPDKKKTFNAWRESHQPFHWFAEFYGVMREGGFDVVIGNPPYIQLSEVTQYDTRGYSCTDCGNIYPVVLERCLTLNASTGRQGYIVPVSSISTDGYKSLQEKYYGMNIHVSCYDDRPSRLFDGLEHIRLVIFLLSHNKPSSWHSTRYHKWTSLERGTLFKRLTYIKVREGIIRNAIPKLTSNNELSIFDKLLACSMTIGARVLRSGRNSINFSRKVGYFLQVLDFQPRVVDGAGNPRAPSEFKQLVFGSSEEKSAALAVLNSNLFYWFMTLFSDCRHLNKREIDAMPLPDVLHECAQVIKNLDRHTKELMTNLRATADTRTMRFRHDCLEIECIIPKRSKRFIDAIDQDLAKAFGFTPEETDFIINYDIKYRMGGAGDEEE
ncbi:MAG: SAM-dependent methyltransferase [Betaproteobacteria bacterium]|nr:SAM-dependent methyltransferase [Betaproteobacteria bacterium]